MPAVSRVLVLAAYAVGQMAFWALVAMVASIASLAPLPAVTCAYSSPHQDLLPAFAPRPSDAQECR
jgi:hypothetical protein